MPRFDIGLFPFDCFADLIALGFQQVEASFAEFGFDRQAIALLDLQFFEMSALDLHLLAEVDRDRPAKARADSEVGTGVASERSVGGPGSGLEIL